MIDYDFFDHVSSEEGQFNGATFKERVNDYAEYENTYVGECIALRSSGINVEWCMSAWKESQPHWDIIINPNLKEVGIGLLEGEWNGYPHSGLHTADFGGGSISVDLYMDNSDIQFNPSLPNEGQDVEISATVHNIGQTDAFPVRVKFYDGDPNSGGIQIGDEQQVTHIMIHGESGTVSVTWDTTGKSGEHDIHVVVDGDNIISETNEGNNDNSKSVTVEESNPPSNPPIHLNEGWNLVSFPYIVTDTSIENVLSSIAGEYDAVQFYNSSSDLNLWQHYHVSKPPQMNKLRDLNNKMGFWINVIGTNGADLIIEGDSPTSSQYLFLHEGWNLVGYPSTTERHRNDALNNLLYGNEIDAIEYYDKTSGKVERLDEGEFMEPGIGYWLHANQDCMWIVLN
ncbi:MAG: hypothetical protein A7315_05005 [Candidatus Altiarchaeales archaeon WOR_SM1_79]|nr:MAG: hypothetical protein A7315_05005 [Candidatus Altiarchaeales archaeon WOR_SM1_79]